MSEKLCDGVRETKTQSFLLEPSPVLVAQMGGSVQGACRPVFAKERSSTGGWQVGGDEVGRSGPEALLRHWVVVVVVVDGEEAAG